MSELKLWQFGNRWEALETTTLTLQVNDGIPSPLAADQSLTARQARTLDPITNPLFTAVVATIALLIGLMLSGYDKSVTSLSDYVFKDAENYATLLYLVFLFMYVWYITRYYRVIWFGYYSLFEPSQNDSSDFMLYGVAIFVVSCAVMIIFPLFWPAAFVILFLFLVIKKNRTRTRFCKATDEFLNAAGISDVDKLYVATDLSAHANLPLWARQLISARVLSISFTINFFVWGILVFGTCALAGLYFLVPHQDFQVTTGEYGHQIFSSFLVVSVAIFYLMKVAGGINKIKNQIEAGEWKGFGLWRKPW